MATTARRRLPLALTAAVAVALGACALTATGAQAAEVPLKDYQLTWGIKESFRTYVTGAFAQGSFTAADGASQADDNGAFTFTSGTGTYDSTTHAVDLAFQGTLTIALHGTEITLADVKFDSTAAEITADVTKSGTTEQDVPLADVTVTQEMTAMATTLTSEAATVFGSSSYNGAAGDPLSVTQQTPESRPPSDEPPTDEPPTDEPPTNDPTTENPAPTPTSTPTDSNSPTTTATSSPSASTSAATKGEITDGTLGWGVKESFRTYVVGSVANGKITASDSATQAADNGVFTFTDATGAYDTDADTLVAAFAGAVNFKGHEATDGTYGLDLTLSEVKVELDGGKGELRADVTSLGEEKQDVPLADLTADSAELTAEDDVITLDDVRATVTKEGAEAFAGFYSEGTELDPVDLSVALTADAQLPGGDGESSASATASDAASGTGTTTGGTGTGTTTGGTGALAATGADVPVATLGAAAAVTVAAGAGVVVGTRRRRTAR
jgi:hypothetical protein